MATMHASGLRLIRVGRMTTGTIFRFPGDSVYWMKINAETRGDDIQAVALNTPDDSGKTCSFRGDLEAIEGPMGLPSASILPLGF